MKRIIVMLLMLAMVFGFVAGCAKEEAAAPAAAEEKVVEKAAAPEVKVNAVEKAALAYFADFPGNRIITTEDVMSKIDAGEEFMILDIRSAADYEAGHLKGAVQCSMGTCYCGCARLASG